MISKVFKNETKLMSNEEICELTGLKNYEISLLLENNLPITDDIKAKLNKIRIMGWKTVHSEYLIDLFKVRLGVSCMAVSSYMIMDNSIYILLMIILIIIGVEGVWNTPFFNFLKRMIKRRN